MAAYGYVLSQNGSQKHVREGADSAAPSNLLGLDQ